MNIGHTQRNSFEEFTCYGILAYEMEKENFSLMRWIWLYHGNQDAENPANVLCK